MAKILIHSDNHWSTSSSIVTQFGNKYTVKLEHQINSCNWITEQAKLNNCDMTICAGDFFDTPKLNEIELTALTEIKFPDNIPNYFIVGNHDATDGKLTFSSTQALAINNPTNCIIDTFSNIIVGDTQIHFVPYITESDRESLTEYLTNVDKSLKQIIISHNDIAGINFGGFISKAGFSIEEIETNCDLYLNGHLHNSEWITKKILNVGSYMAHNFTNDSDKYKYGIWILDTDDLSVKFIENPYGLNFYHFEINSKDDFKQFENLKPNAVCSIKCISEFIVDLKAYLSTIQNIITYRIITILAQSDSNITLNKDELSLSNYLPKFKDLCLEKIGNSQVLDEVLTEVLA